MEDIIETMCVLLGAALSWLLGGLDGFIRVLVAFVVIDYLTGVIAAYITHTLDSNTGFHGIMRKAVIFMLVSVANIVDTEILSKLLGHTELFRDTIIFFYLGNEGISILENAIKLGIPFPEHFKKRFLSWVEGDNINPSEPNKPEPPQ